MITDIYNKLKGMVIGLSPLYLLTLLLITTSCNKVVETDDAVRVKIEVQADGSRLVTTD